MGKLQKLLELIVSGESEKVEFKEKPSQLAEEIVAMANSLGGVILVGISDTGKVVGVDEKKFRKVFDGVVQAISPPLELKTEKFEIDGKTVFAVYVPQSTTIATVGGIAYIRIGTSKRKLRVDELLMLAGERAQVRFDEMPSSIEFEINENVRFFAEKAGIKDVVKYLLSVKAVARKKNKLYFTAGGVLFFHAEPQEIYPQASARIIELNAENVPISHLEFKGPLWKMADSITDWFLKNLRSIEVVTGSKREKILEYPVRALREAVINALIHRNYFIQADVRIFVSPSMIKVRSPGSLVPGVDLNDPEHVPRNRVLCELMYRLGYIEKYGYGITLMRKLCDTHPYCKLSFRSGRNYFDVIFEKTYSKEALDDIDRKIISLVKIRPMKSSEIAKNIGMSKQAIVKRLNKLISLGILRKTGSGPGIRYELS